MTTQEINIAIAESLGWTIFHRNDKGEIKSWKSPDGSIWQEPWTPLRFAEDLNAMHEVEKTLNRRDHTNYTFNLRHICCAAPEIMESEFNYWFVANATALQRAEAYLCTIGKWKD